MGSSASDDDSEGGSSGIGSRFTELFEELGSYIRVTRAQKILRRYFAMNAFDGAMTSLGVVIGTHITGIADSLAVIGVILVSGVAMAVSGFSGTYMAESAERMKALNELEDAMLSDLNETIYGQASRFVSFLAALVDGSAPFMASIPSVMPYALALYGIVSMEVAFLASVFASMAILFLLGVFLGRVSRGNVVWSGVKMVVAGVAVAVLALLLNGH